MKSLGLNCEVSGTKLCGLSDLAVGSLGLECHNLEETSSDLLLLSYGHHAMEPHVSKVDDTLFLSWFLPSLAGRLLLTERNG